MDRGLDNAGAGVATPPVEQTRREVRFDNPDFPYLFLAHLRREFGDTAALRLAIVIPSPSGPSVLLDPDALNEPLVPWLVNTLQGELVD